MNVLMIFQSAPLPPPMDMGAAKRNFPFFRENLKYHDVSVIAYGSPEEERLFREHFGDRCKHIVFIQTRRPRFVNVFRRIFLLLSGKSTFHLNYSRKCQDAIDHLVSIERFDVIHCCLAIFGFYRFPEGVARVADTHNVEYEIVYRRYLETKNPVSCAYIGLVARRAKKAELELCRQFPAMMTTTSVDRDTFHKDLLEMPIFVVQNGVDQSFFEKQNVRVRPHSMVFMGLMNWYPNRHAIDYFLDSIYPIILERIPDAHLTIVGANPSSELLRRASAHVAVTGFVKDVRPHVAAGEVFIIPLIIGSGIRGKALEAMAMRKPIVSTTIGCAGINLRHNESALFADTAEDFADCVVRLFQDSALRTRLGEAAHRTAIQDYDWQMKGEELQRVYRFVLNGRQKQLSVPVAEERAI